MDKPMICPDLMPSSATLKADCAKRPGAVVDRLVCSIMRLCGRLTDFLAGPHRLSANAPDGVLVFDDGGQAIGINAAALRLLNWPSLSIGADLGALLNRFPALRRIAPGKELSQTAFMFRVNQSLRKVSACRMTLRTRSGEICAELYAFHVLKTCFLKPGSGDQSAAEEKMFESRADGEKKTQTICCSCKRVRDKNGRWVTVETYIQSFLNIQFSHGICPECMEKLYGEESFEERSAPVCPSERASHLTMVS